MTIQKVRTYSRCWNGTITIRLCSAFSDQENSVLQEKKLFPEIHANGSSFMLEMNKKVILQLARCLHYANNHSVIGC